MKKLLCVLLFMTLTGCVSSVLLDPCSRVIHPKPPCYDMSWPVQFGRIKPDCYCVCPHPQLVYKN